MEQWEHFGQEWLDRQAVVQSAPIQTSNPYAPAPSVSSPVASEAVLNIDPFAPSSTEVQMPALEPAPEPSPSVSSPSQGTDILDFDL
tara:strand:- start:1591 stop:1851 length:261 start_codon:yes stop_codon:yes gene_type:complete